MAAHENSGVLEEVDGTALLRRGGGWTVRVSTPRGFQEFACASEPMARALFGRLVRSSAFPEPARRAMPRAPDRHGTSA